MMTSLTENLEEHICVKPSQELDSFWKPFTNSRGFGKRKRVITSASGHYYTSDDSRKLYDIFSGLWTTGLGHCHPKIVEAVQKQAASLDYSMSFQVSSDIAIEFANKLTSLAPKGFTQCFFTNSGSESVETALKMALAYHRLNGEATRTRLIGRERGYHGVNFGGMSVGGIFGNRKMFSGNLLSNVDHMRHTHDLEHNSFSKGLPLWGDHLAGDLERLVNLHDQSNIAAVIVEPVGGSTGILPPPVGYLKKLRRICDQYGILLIFDEVITAFGRIGEYFSPDRFGVVPDIITCAKGITNGVVPMGAVLVREEIYDSFMQGPDLAVEFSHGYTYSGHPLACAAGLATMEVFEEEGILEQSRALEPVFEEAIHTLDHHPKIKDVRNLGLMGGIDIKPSIEGIGVYGNEVFMNCFFEENIVLRASADTLQFAPCLNAKAEDIYMVFEKLKKVIDNL
jgi:beta-alanine--pyruvate transaminase